LKSTTKANTPTNISRNEKCGPKNKNQICPKNECCSKYGYCGKSSAHCDKGCQTEFDRCNNNAIQKMKTNRIIENTSSIKPHTTTTQNNNDNRKTTSTINSSPTTVKMDDHKIKILIHNKDYLRVSYYEKNDIYNCMLSDFEINSNTTNINGIMYCGKIYNRKYVEKYNIQYHKNLSLIFDNNLIEINDIYNVEFFKN